MEARGRTRIRLHAIQRYTVWHYLQPVVNNIRVREFPKSGGTWLCQMLGDLFDLPYPRNTSLPIRMCIQHEHYVATSGFKTINLIRDGRDVMTSAYFHFIIADTNRPPTLLHKWRSLVSIEEYEDVVEMMPRFIKIFGKHYKVGGVNVSWSDHVMRVGTNSDKSLCIKYEDLLTDAESELEKICAWYQHEPCIPFQEVIEKYNFKNQSSRKQGEEDKQKFLRKGIQGDWKNYFSEEALGVFDSLHGRALQHYGYV